jgi:hypothetical protein
VKDKLFFFASLEAAHEDASIAYSPASLTQFQALAGLAGQGLIPGVSSISVPNNVPVPFRDYLGDLRFDWAQSSRAQWFLRAALDTYTTDNAFVEQATLPSTGATWHSNYGNLVLGQQFIFSPTWLGTFTLAGSGLRLNEYRNSQLGFALAFPSVPPRRRFPASKPLATTSSSRRSRPFPSCGIRKNTRSVMP